MAQHPAGDQPFVRTLLIVLATFALMASVSYIAQGKNWFYHRLPAAIAAVLALLLWVAGVLRARPAVNFRLAASAVLALLTLAEFAWSDYDRLRSWVEAAVEPNLSTEVKLERLVKRRRRTPTSPSPNGSRWAFRW